MNTSGLLKKLLSSNADDVASRLSSKYVDDAARAVQSFDDDIIRRANTLPSRNQIMDDVLGAVDKGTIDDVYRAAADMPVLARTTHTRPASGGGMPKDNTFLDDIAQRLYATKGNPKATRDLINKYMLAFGGAIPAGGVLAGLMGGNDDQSMV